MASSRFGCSDGFTLAGRMSDRRAQRRVRSPRVVQVSHDGDAAYARCRDFSDSGMKLDLTAPLQLNDVVTVALTPSIMLCGTVAWVRGRECGIRFEETVDSDALLEAVEPAAGHDTAQGPTTLNMLGGRHWPERPAPAATRRTGIHFEAGLAVTVMVGPNQEQRGVVRWAKDNLAALEFTTEPASPTQTSGLLPAPE